MYLFVIGLEMQPSHLWSLRREIFGLGTLQIIACALALTGVGLYLDLNGKLHLLVQQVLY
jgi:glutathione-regulated potassium-efflux system protein KefB